MTNTYRRPDRFARAAREAGYAARSVFKLAELDRRIGLLRPGMRVVDLGCHPGSWSRYVLERIGAEGRLVGVDLRAPSLSGGVFLERSVHDVTAEELLALLSGPADLVLSDMAPSTTGDRFADHCAQLELARRASDLATRTLRPGGVCVIKVFEGEDAPAFEAELRRLFTKVRRVRPEAVRKQSREHFVVGEGFRG